MSWPDMMTPWAAELAPAGGGTAGSRDLDDAGVLEDAALILLRRYPGTRPDGLEGTIANLQWIVRTIRRQAAPDLPLRDPIQARSGGPDYQQDSAGSCSRPPEELA